MFDPEDSCREQLSIPEPEIEIITNPVTGEVTMMPIEDPDTCPDEVPPEIIIEPLTGVITIIEDETQPSFTAIELPDPDEEPPAPAPLATPTEHASSNSLEPPEPCICESGEVGSVVTEEYVDYAEEVEQAEQVYQAEHVLQTEDVVQQDEEVEHVLQTEDEEV